MVSGPRWLSATDVGTFGALERRLRGWSGLEAKRKILAPSCILHWNKPAFPSSKVRADWGVASKCGSDARMPGAKGCKQAAGPGSQNRILLGSGRLGIGTGLQHRGQQRHREKLHVQRCAHMHGVVGKAREAMDTCMCMQSVYACVCMCM